MRRQRDVQQLLRLINVINRSDPARVRSDLLQHEIITEDFGGDVLCVDVSAHTGMGLDKLESYYATG